MAFHLFVSNSLKGLSIKLAAGLTGASDVFQPYHIVTQTEGMNNWLKIQLAEQLGIAANICFLKPNEIIHKVYNALEGEKVQALSEESMQWLYYTLLNDNEFKNTFPDIAAYFGGDNSKRLSLATKLADLFDQYQIYRPEIMRTWNQQSDRSATEFQEWLWRRAKTIAGSAMPDKTLIGEYILQALDNPEKRAKLQNWPALHFFGLSIITAYHINILSALAKYIDIHFHLLNPAPSVYWFDDRSEKRIALWNKSHNGKILPPDEGNKLLTSWGRIVQDTFSLFFKEEELLNSYQECNIKENFPATLLGKLQREVFSSALKEEPVTIAADDIQDGSIVINACYTPAREVEVLYNYLVQLVEKSKEPFAPRDVVVMVSDIDKYAPYIKAVFDTAPYPFPYTIADECYKGNESLLQTLEQLLCLEEDTFKGEDVLQLLETSYIKKRFNIKDTELIRQVVNEACFRFGLNGDDADDSIHMSCTNALKRIMFGICMAGDEEQQFNSGNFYPVDLVEGTDALELVKFCHFATILMTAIENRKEEQTVKEWAAYIDDTVKNLLSENGKKGDEEYILLLRELQKLYMIPETLTEKVSYSVFRQHFLNMIKSHSKASAFASKGVTFCSFIPMRSLPFKVVAMLGVNLNKFPRKETQTGFSLMNERKLGDRNVKDNDKHLFLETLLSAQEHLYISYIGRSVKDNNPVPPSSLVDELMDYIAVRSNVGENVRKQLVTVHPLHGLSSRYNKKEAAGKQLFNYLVEQKKEEEERPSSGKNKESGSELQEIQLESLINFFKNPFKSYYNQVLKIKYKEEDVLLPDCELFKLEKLHEWQLKQDLLLMKDEEVERYRDKLVKKGKLPLKNMAAVELQALSEEINDVRALFNELTGGRTLTKVNVDISLEEARLKGSVNSIYDTTLLSVAFSSRETKYLLEAYIRYLAVIAQGIPVTAKFISAKKCQDYASASLSIQEALDRLSDLVKIYLEGQENIVAFYPDFGIEPEDLEDFGKKLDKSLKNTFENSEVPCWDLYILKEYNQQYFNSQLIRDQMRKNYERILNPVAEVFPTYYSIKATETC